MLVKIIKEVPYDNLNHFPVGSEVEVLEKHECEDGIKYKVISKAGYKDILDEEFVEVE